MLLYPGDVYLFSRHKSFKSLIESHQDPKDDGLKFGISGWPTIFWWIFGGFLDVQPSPWLLV